MCDLQTRNHFMRKSFHPAGWHVDQLHLSIGIPGASFMKSNKWKVLIFSREIWSVNCQFYQKSAIVRNLRFQSQVCHFKKMLGVKFPENIIINSRDVESVFLHLQSVKSQSTLIYIHHVIKSSCPEVSFKKCVLNISQEKTPLSPESLS